MEDGGLHVEEHHRDREAGQRRGEAERSKQLAAREAGHGEHDVAREPDRRHRNPEEFGVARLLHGLAAAGRARELQMVEMRDREIARDPDPERGEDEDRETERAIAQRASAASSAGLSADAVRLVVCTSRIGPPVRPTAKLGVDVTPAFCATPGPDR